jgi:hypothetical protein
MPSLNTGNAILSNALKVDSSYNVGIGGAASGSFKLQVTGTTNLTGALTGTSATFSGIGTFGSSAGAGLRVYGSSGTNQWDIYLNSTNLRFSDNTGTGSVVFDRPLSGTSASFSSSVTATTGTTGAAIKLTGVTNYGFIEDANAVRRIWFENTGDYRTILDLPASGTAFQFRNSSGSILTTITSGGNVGIGTSSPPSRLSVQWNKSTAFSGLGIYDSQAYNASNHGGTVTFGGTFNSAGSYTEWSAIGGMKSNTTDGNISGDINFYTRFDGSGMIERMKLTNPYSGSNYTLLQIGTNDNSKVTIIGNSDASGDANVTLYGGAGSNGVTDSSYYQIRATSGGTTRAWILQIDASNQLATFYNNGSTWSKLGYQSTSGTWTNSDERRKTNIEDLEYGLKEVLQLKPKKFNFKHDTEVGNIKQKDMGFIAQEVLPIMPLAVDSDMDGEQQYYSMNYANIIPTLVKAIQELSAKVENQQQTINSLINR